MLFFKYRDKNFMVALRVTQPLLPPQKFCSRHLCNDEDRICKIYNNTSTTFPGPT